MQTTIQKNVFAFASDFKIDSKFTVKNLRRLTDKVNNGSIEVWFGPTEYKCNHLIVPTVSDFENCNTNDHDQCVLNALYRPTLYCGCGLSNFVTMFIPKLHELMHFGSGFGLMTWTREIVPVIRNDRCSKCAVVFRGTVHDLVHELFDGILMKRCIRCGFECVNQICVAKHVVEHMLQHRFFTSPEFDTVVSQCDFRVLELFSHFKTVSVVTVHNDWRKNVWRDYLNALKAKKEKENAKKLIKIMEAREFCDNRTLIGRLFNQQKYSPHFFDFNFSLFPSTVVEKLKTLIAGIVTWSGDWVEKFWTFVCDLVKEYGFVVKMTLFILLVKICEVLRLNTPNCILMLLVATSLLSGISKFSTYKKLQTGVDDILSIVKSLQSEEFGRIGDQQYTAHASDTQDASLLVSIIASGFGWNIDKDKVQKFISFCRISALTGSALRSWTFIVGFLHTHLKTMWEFFTGTEIIQALMCFDSQVDVKRAIKWMEEIEFLDTPSIREQIYFDPSLQERCLKTKEVGFVLLKAATTTRDPLLMNAVRALHSNAIKLADVADHAMKTHDVRFDPMVVYVEGPPGIGKSSNLNRVGKEMMEQFGPVGSHWLYSLNAALDFWPGYRKQPVVAIDEFDALSDEDARADIKNLMKIASNAPFIVPMADIPDKETTFESKIVMVYSNTLYPIHKSISHKPEAILRRRTCVFQMQILDIYRNQYPNMEPEEIVKQLDPKVRDDVSYATFQEWHTTKQIKIGQPLTWAALRITLKERFKKHVKGQIKVLENNDAFVPLWAREAFTESNDDVLSEIAAIMREDEPRDLLLPKLVPSWKEKFKASKISNKFWRLKEILLDSFKNLVDHKERIWQGLKELPWLKIILTGAGIYAVIQTIATIASAYFHISEEEYTPYMHPSGDARTKFKPVRRIVMPSNNVIKYEPHSGDVNAEQLVRERLPNCIFSVTIKEDGWLKPRIMFGTAIGGRLILLPRHFFSGLSGEMLITVSDGMTSFSEYVDPERLYQIEDWDVCAYEMSSVFPIQRKLGMHFISEKELERINSTPVMMYNGTITKEGFAKPIDKNEVSYHTITGAIKEEWFVRRGWEANIKSMPGDCGSLLVASNNQIQRKLLGILNAGVDHMNASIFCLVTNEMIGKLHARSTTGSLQHQELDTKYIAHSKSPVLVPDGNFTHLAVLDKNYCQYQPTKTNIRASPIQGLLAPILTAPAILSIHDPRNDKKISPLGLALTKYGTPGWPWKYLFLEQARESLEQHLVLMRPEYNKIDEHFLLYGDGTGTHRINMSSSAGFPFKLEVKVGGKMGFVELAEGSEYILTDTMRQAVIDRLTKWRDGLRPCSFWNDNLKDERRKLEKIEQVSTRHFVIPPFDFTLATRALTLHFVSAITSNRVKYYSAVGMDVHSSEWHYMIERHLNHGEESYDGDVGNFDGMMSGLMVEQFFRAMNNWYELYFPNGLKVEIGNFELHLTHKDCVRMRMLMCDEIVHTIQLCLDLVYVTHQGNPSGNPLTTILNTFVNGMYMRYAFYEHCSVLGQSHDYNNIVCDTLYGDDGFFTVKKGFGYLMNFGVVERCLNMHGIRYTAANKQEGGAAVTPLGIRFLKCGVGMFDTMHCPNMDWDTINEMTNWVRATNDIEALDQLYINIENASREVFFYGKKEYVQYISKVSRALLEKGFHPVGSKYSQLYSEFRAKFGM